MTQLLAVMAGGAMGAGLRFLSVSLVVSLFASAPVGTLLVNVVGSGLMGLLIGWITTGGLVSKTLELFLIVGILGSFTTFSSFAMDFLRLEENDHFVMALVYAAASVFISILACYAGFKIGRAL